MQMNALTKLDEEVEIAKKHLKDLIAKTGPDHPVLSRITEDELRKSRSLRSTLEEYKEYYFLIYNDPKHLKKNATPEQKKVDNYQSYQ